MKGVAGIRTDPYYTVSPEIKDDVAVLTLNTPLELSAAENAEAIQLVPAGATPAPGTTLSISGYGKEEGAEGAQPTGQLYSTTLTAISSDACRNQVQLNSAVLLCAESASSSTCQGDSGGPLTEGSPPVQVGIVDFGTKECPVGQPDVFTNIAAPEIRDFIEGDESPPVARAPDLATGNQMVWAARRLPSSHLPVMRAGGAGRHRSPTPSRWKTGPPQMLQSGPANAFAPLGSLVGSTVVCIVQASNAGGTSTGRSQATPAIARRHDTPERCDQGD